MGPPPRTTSRWGSSFAAVASRLSHAPTSPRPSMGGITGTDQRLAGDASEVGALPAHQALLHDGHRDPPIGATAGGVLPRRPRPDHDHVDVAHDSFLLGHPYASISTARAGPPSPSTTFS